jgi:ribonuclease P protein component
MLMVNSSQPLRNTLRKSERISSKKLFELLFSSGKSFRVGILRFTFIHPIPSDMAAAPLMVAFLVPKRQFKRAVDRNYIRRRMREAWRLNKNTLAALLVEQGKSLAVMVKVETKKRPGTAEIRPALVSGLQKLETLIQ